MPITRTELIALADEIGELDKDRYDAEEFDGVMEIMDPTRGDLKLIWTRGVQVEVDHAKKMFAKFTKRASAGGPGYLAYSVRADGEAGEVIKEFDPSVERMILRPGMAGG